MIDAFKTRLGWVAVLWHDAGLVRLRFGYSTKDDALAALRQAIDTQKAALKGTDSISQKTGRWEYADRIRRYAAGQPVDLSCIPIDRAGYTDFQVRVLQQCRRIALGETITYGQLAHRAGSDRAARAVGSCMAANRTPLVIPCHRVVPTGGRQFGAYSAEGGTVMKQRLIELERRMVATLD